MACKRLVMTARGCGIWVDCWFDEAADGEPNVCTLAQSRVKLLTATHPYELTRPLVRGILVNISCGASRAGGLMAGFGKGEAVFRGMPPRMVGALVSIQAPPDAQILATLRTPG